ncbi:MAG TPA: adenylate/guanylate cyclase domain-containing protein [Micromonosporaceae bacterium]
MPARCNQCGRTASPGDRFCGGCGTALAARCPRCAAPLAPDAAFCTSCGAPAAGGSAAIIKEERRRVSILFIDLIGFTPYVEQTDPELVRAVQTSFFTTTQRVINGYGGVVEKYIGDAVMALFGAPVATETDALRCVRAGLELQRALAHIRPGADENPAYAQRYRDADPPVEGFRFRVGIATGEALVDVAAARDGGQAFVAGDVVNSAARLQSVAPPGGVLVCGNTYTLTRSAIRYEEQPAITLRGRSTPTEVWLARSAVSRRRPERETDNTPLIDREHELALLINALHRSIRERVAQLVTVAGPAGIGKSRLVRELYRYVESLPDATVSWRTGRCPPFGENVTFAALADIVKSEAGILDTDPADTAAERLTRAVGDLVGPADADQLVEALRPLVGLPGSRLPAEELEALWRRFLIAIAGRRPTILVFEDLHWADEAMLRFVELLGATAREVPLLLLCTSRPELADRHPLRTGDLAASLTITLAPLREAGIRSLFAHMFGAAPVPPDRLDRLIELTAGNPLYAQEYVRMLVEQGALGRPGPMRADPPMPDSVHAVIANRIDLLDPPDRAVLLAASVVGMQFWPGAVAAALNEPIDTVEQALRRLEQRDFVHLQSASSMAGQPEFQFQHILVRDVCYQRLPRTARVAQHNRAAEWLDARSRERDTDLAEVIANHYWAAHRIARTLRLDTAHQARIACEALHRAARRAYALHALDAAAGHVERALTLCEHTESLSRRRLELLRAEIDLQRKGALLAHDGEDLIPLAEELLALGDPAGAARAWTLLGQLAWLQADRGQALAYLNRAVVLFARLPDTAAKADAYAELGRLHMLNYERDPAIAAAGAAAAIAERLGLVEVQANAQITVALARYQAGDSGGLTALQAATDFCRERQLRALPRAIQNLAHAVREEGDWVRSDALLRESPGGQALTTGYSAEAMHAYFAGDFHRLLAAADAFVDTPAGRWDMQVRGLRSWLRVLRGETPPDDVTDALETARRSGFHRLHWTMLSMGALYWALQGRHDEATELLGELADSWGPVPALASGEWVAAAGYAAALAGQDASVRVQDMLGRVRHATPWSRAAENTVSAALAESNGQHAEAARRYLAAARIYADIPDETDRMMALALAVGALRRTADPRAAEAVAVEVREFAERNQAPGLLRLAVEDLPTVGR